MADITTGKVQDLTPHEGTRPASSTRCRMTTITSSSPTTSATSACSTSTASTSRPALKRWWRRTRQHHRVEYRPRRQGAAAGATDGVNKTLLYRETEAEPFKAAADHQLPRSGGYRGLDAGQQADVRGLQPWPRQGRAVRVRPEDGRKEGKLITKTRMSTLIRSAGRVRARSSRRRW